MSIERNLRRLATVPRWAVVPTIKSQSVAEHSFHVAWMADWLRGKITVAIDQGELLEACLEHDNDEAIFGDPPSPSKPALSAAGLDGPAYDDIKCMVKIADVMEAVIFIREDQELGNKSLGPILEDLMLKGPYWCEQLRAINPWPVPTFSLLVDWLWHEVRPDLHPAMLASKETPT